MKKALVLTGSDSDIAKLVALEREFNKAGIDFEKKIASAHRNTQKVEELVRMAEETGIEVLMGGAGMSAHLAGVMSAYTKKLPVIGMPFSSKEFPDGEDAYLSMSQMPPGVPVLTAGVDASGYAAQAAINIINTNKTNKVSVVTYSAEDLERVKSMLKVLDELGIDWKHTELQRNGLTDHAKAKQIEGYSSVIATGRIGNGNFLDISAAARDTTMPVIMVPIPSGVNAKETIRFVQSAQKDSPFLNTGTASVNAALAAAAITGVCGEKLTAWRDKQSETAWAKNTEYDKHTIESYVNRSEK